MAYSKKPATTITIDAAGQTLGRLASNVASKLRGKNLVTFDPKDLPDVGVTVTNIEKLRFTGTKLTGKFYYRYSGYPGGITKTSLKQEFEKNPEKLFRHTVARMLPKNRLNSRALKNLTVRRGA